MNLNVIVADDHPATRLGYVYLLEQIGIFSKIRQAENGRKLIDTIGEEVPDLVLLDTDMPVMDGEQALEIISLRFPSVKIMIICSQAQENLMIHFIKKGAHGFIGKDASQVEVMDAIHSLKKDGYYFSKLSPLTLLKFFRNKSPVHKNSVPGLTEREIRIIRLICDEKTNKEIAVQLSIAVKTVDFHRKNIYRKTGTHSSAGIVKFALVNSLIDLPYPITGQKPA